MNRQGNLNDESFEEQIKNATEKAYDEELEKINAQLNQEITFAMIGEVNSGKSSTINQLLEDEVATVGPAPGETIVIQKYQYKDNDKIIFADTPGLNDINEDNSAETEQFFKEIDIILFFLNAAGTVFSNKEKEVFDKLRNLNENILLILNKIDVVDEVDPLVDYIKEHTGSSYKIIPISSRTGENIEKLNDEILDILKKKNKDIQYGKHMKNKSKIANRWIVGAATSAGAVGALPMPGSDFIPLTSLQVGLLMRLATLYEKKLSKENAKELIIASITGNIGKTVFRQIVKVIPGAGSVAGAGVASGMTLALGYGAKYGYENDLTLNTQTMKELYNKFKNEQKQEH